MKTPRSDSEHKNGAEPSGEKGEAETMGSCDPPAEIDPFLFEDLSRLNNELANLQRAMAKKNAQLEQINHQKNQLLGMAAHDLRDPLGVITSFGFYLKEVLGEKLDDNQRQMLTMIESNSRFMVDLIDDLLEIVKFESGELRLEPEPIDLAELVRQNLALHRVIAEGKKMRLAAEIERSLPPVVADRHKLEQVLNNLISNAIKYSHPESEITVRLRLDGSGARVLLQVADQGQGIPEDELEGLFQPFQRTSVQTTGGEKSTGLGLAIVKRIVEGHQGRIRVESEVGHGSTFSVELPLQSPPAESG